MKKKHPYYFLLTALVCAMFIFVLGYGFTNFYHAFPFSRFQDLDQLEQEEQIRSSRPLWHALPRYLLPQNSIFSPGL
jgi:hypothetical protein